MNSRLVDESLNWRRLCRAAVLEQDPDKLLQIVQRINAALISRQQMLRGLEKQGGDHNSHFLGGERTC
jgi:hypothetical protein